MNNKREQRCIELYERLKSQFIRSHLLDDADKGLLPVKDSNDYNRQIAAHEAALLVSSLIRLTAHMGLDDFNSNWFFYSDYIYQDEDIDAQESLQAALKSEMSNK
jgi:hypothetical protein